MITLIALLLAPVLGYAIGTLRAQRLADVWITGMIYKIEAERDRYREIAESHEVRWTGWPKDVEVEWVTPSKFGEKRSYDGSMEANLVALERDILAEIGTDARIRLTLQPWMIGAWSKHLAEKGWVSSGKKLDTDVWTRHRPVELVLTGTAAEIMREARTALQDPAWDLWKNHAWAVPDGLCSIVVSNVMIRVIHEPPPRPTVVEIQVAVPAQPAQSTESAPLETDPDLDARIAVAVEIALTEAEARRKTMGKWPASPIGQNTATAEERRANTNENAQDVTP